MKTKTTLQIIGVLGAGVLAYRLANNFSEAAGNATEKVIQVAKKVVTEDLNPVSDKNIVYAVANTAGSVVTGDADFSLGVKIWEWLNPGKVAAEKAAIAPTALKVADTKANNITAASSWEQWFPDIELVTDPAAGFSAFGSGLFGGNLSPEENSSRMKTNFLLSEKSSY